MSPAARQLRRAKGRRKGAAHRSRLHPLVIAALMIALTAAITYYAFAQQLPFEHKFTVHALVSNSVNVRSDSPVRIAGIDVGVVQGVKPAGDASEVTFTLDNNGLPIHKDATIRIRDRLFLEGGYYLELDPGSPSAPIAPDGYTIAEQQTSSPVQFYQLLSTFDIASRASLTQLLDTMNQGFSPRSGQPLSDSGAGAFKRSIPQLTPVLKDVAWVTRALRGTHQGDVEQLLSSTADVTSTLAGSSAQLTDLVSGLNQTSSALASSDGALAQTISGLDQTLQVAPAALSAIDHSLPPLASLAVALDPSLKVAPPILTKLISIVGQLASVVAPAERGPLLTSLRATFTQFPVILTQLASAFPLTKQVTDCLRTHVVPTLNSEVPDGSLSTGRPVWQDFVHFLPNIGGATGNFDANGPYTRVLAGAGANSLTGEQLSLGSLPLFGKLIGASAPGGGSVLGARPAWVGDLTSADFHPEAKCASQPVPSLAAPTAASDLRSAGQASAPALTAAQLSKLLAKLGAPGTGGTQSAAAPGGSGASGSAAASAGAAYSSGSAKP